MRVASLFTGAGGLDLGLEQAGHEIILQCESDAGAQQVLKERFPGVLLVPDVCGLQRLPEETELLTAGFPCVDVSRAGLRRGLAGKGTGLVRHVFRLLETALKDRRGIPWVLLENVEALLDRTATDAPVIEFVVASLERLGYHSWAHRVVNSAGFGVPNRRKRVFLVASLHGDARDVLLSQGVEFCRGACRALFSGQACHLCHNPQPSATGEDYSFALDLGNARSSAVVDMVPTFTTNNERICLLLASCQMGMLRIEDAERLQGLPEGHTEPCFPILVPGVGSHRAPPLKDSDVERREMGRWALIGNAVTVPVAKWLGERLMQPYASKYAIGPKDQALQDGGAERAEASQLFGMRAYRPGSRQVPGGENPSLPAGMPPEPALTGEDEAVDEAGMAVEGGSRPAPAETPGAQDSCDTPSQATEGDSTAEDAMLLEFQDTIICEGRKGKLPPPPFVPNRADERWPRCAWYVKGLGRYAARVSDTPIITPLQPLGSFIHKVGKPPNPDAMHTYIQRLKEHGFDVSATVKKALSCGASLRPEVTEVNRLKGMLTDADTIGKLVWAKEGNVWWPGEMLDPFAMPPTRTLPASAIAALSEAELRASIPAAYALQHNAARPGPGLQASLVAAVATPAMPAPPRPQPADARGDDAVATPPEDPAAPGDAVAAVLSTVQDLAVKTEQASTAAGDAVTAALDVTAPVGSVSDADVDGSSGEGSAAGSGSLPEAAQDSLEADKAQQGSQQAEPGSQQAQPPAEAPSASTGAVADTAPALGGALGMVKRKVLVVLFDSKYLTWQRPLDLLPFEANLRSKEAEAARKIEAGQVVRFISLRKAIKEAKETAALKKAHCQDSESYNAAIAARAATNAAAANLRMRCGKCDTCLHGQVTPANI